MRRVLPLPFLAGMVLQPASEPVHTMASAAPVSPGAVSYSVVWYLPFMPRDWFPLAGESVGRGKPGHLRNGASFPHGHAMHAGRAVPAVGACE
jgi:hypothetical protein